MSSSLAHGGEAMKRSFLAVLMVSLVALVAMGSLVSAEQVGDGYVYLFNNGADGGASATTDWRFYVQTREYVGLDDSTGYWNFTCYAQMVNNTGSATTATYTVTMYIASGGVNKSASHSITVSKTATVYGNLSFPEATYSLLDANHSAAVYVKLTNATGTVKDAWTGTIIISKYGVIGMTTALVGTIVGVAIVVMVIGWFGRSMEDIERNFQHGSGDCHGKRRGKR